MSFAEDLAGRYPESAKIFEEMAEEEKSHRHLLLEIYEQRLWSQFHERDHAVFRIEDSGLGIPEAELRRVLEPFYRGSWSTKEGTGLGLSIVRPIAETLGGSVLLENICGRGSTGLRVSVRIPATDKSQGSSEEFRKAAS